MDQIINHARLNAEAPHWRELELSYRPPPKPSDKARALFAVTAFHVAAITVTLLTLFTGVIGFSTWAITVGVLIGVAGGIYTLLRDQGNWEAALPWFAFSVFTPVVVPFLYIFAGFTETRVPFSLIAVGLGFLAADQIANHYYHWLIANNRLPNEVARTRRRWFESRRKPAELETFTAETQQEITQAAASTDAQHRSTAELRLQTLKAIRASHRTWKMLFLFFLVLPHLPMALFPGLLTLVVPTVFVAMALKTTSSVKPRESFKATCRALISWFTYSLSTENVPGVFRSNVGQTPVKFGIVTIGVNPRITNLRFRYVRTAGTIALLSLFTVTSARLFPIGYDLSRLTFQKSWQEVFTSAANRDAPMNFVRWGLMLAPATPIGENDEVIDRAGGPERLFKSFIAARPQDWVYVALQGLAEGRILYLLALVVSFVAALVFPLFLIGLVVFAVAGPYLALTYAAVEAPGAPEQLSSRSEWEAYVERLQRSKVPLENQHLFLGTHLLDDYPILLHREILSEHAYLVGDSGSGKTALGIIPIIRQIIRMNHAAVVVIDLKGDKALFEAVKAEAAGRIFKYFTNELRKPTFAFNPFTQGNNEEVSLNQVCETMLEALNLNHGDGYGRSYFSRVARRWLAATLKKRPDIRSFDELYALTKEEGFTSENERKDAFELIAVIESLASFEQLNLTLRAPKGQEAAVKASIQMPEVIKKKEIVYFWLPSAIETASVREIAKLAVYALLQSAYIHQKTTGTVQQTYLVIDEFQRIASDNFKIVLEQARSLGIGTVLANQTFSDLQTHDTDLRPTVQSNTRLKMCFSATDLNQQQAIMDGSGETITWRYSFSEPVRSMTGGLLARSFSASESIVPRISRNDIIQISDHPTQAICHIVRGSGYSQFSGFSFPIQAFYSTSRAMYDEHMAAPWPEGTPETITVTRAPLPDAPFQTPEDRIVAAEKLREESPLYQFYRSKWLSKVEGLVDYFSGGQKPAGSETPTPIG